MIFAILKEKSLQQVLLASVPMLMTLAYHYLLFNNYSRILAMNNYYLKCEGTIDLPKRKLEYVIRHNKALNSISITYPSRSNFNTKNTVTISEDLGQRTCTCKTYAINGTCYHVHNGLSLLETAFSVLIDEQCSAPQT